MLEFELIYVFLSWNIHYIYRWIKVVWIITHTTYKPIFGWFGLGTHLPLWITGGSVVAENSKNTLHNACMTSPSTTWCYLSPNTFACFQMNFSTIIWWAWDHLKHKRDAMYMKLGIQLFVFFLLRWLFVIYLVLFILISN